MQAHSFHNVLILSCIGFQALACDRMSYYRGCSFTNDVAEAFRPCIETEVRKASSEVGIELVFDPCGPNDFLNFAWAPDGFQLYHELPNRAVILNAETSQVSVIGQYLPHGPGGWLDATTLVLPIPPLGYNGDEADLPVASRMGIFNQIAELQVMHEIAYGEPRDLQPYRDDQHMLMTAIDPADGQRRPYLFDPASGAVLPVLQDLGVVNNLSWVGPDGLLAYHNGEAAIIQEASTGQVVQQYSDVTRAVVHPDSTFVALETLGPPTSIFFQRLDDDELTEAQIRREEAKRAEFEADLPEGFPSEVEPPEIHFYDVERKQRYRTTAWQGDHFQWYEYPKPGEDDPRTHQPLFSSMILWGIKTKQFQRNIVGVDAANVISDIQIDGDSAKGIEIFPQ